MSDAGLPPGAERELATFLERWLGREEVPGISLAVFDADGLLHAAGLGARDVAAGDPATPDTRYAVGSLAKPPTAIAVLQLVGNGTVSLSDSVDDHLPRPVLADAPGDPVTVGDLLSHSSGMPRDFYALRENLASREDRLRHVEAAADQRRTDRERYAYYNSGFVLLGELVETVDGRPHPEYVEEEVLDPLGMADSGFDTSLLDAEDAMTGYPPDDDEFQPAGNVAREIEQAGASGGFVSTATDLARLGRWVLNGGELDGMRPLDPSLVAEMTDYQSPILETTGGDRAGYGYGIELTDFLGETLLEHPGNLFVAGGYLGCLPHRGLGVALAYNSTGFPWTSVGRGALAVACGEDPVDSVRMLAVTEAVDAVTGTYTSHNDVTSATVEEGPLGTVRVDPPGPMGPFTAAPGEVAGPNSTFSVGRGDGYHWELAFDDTDEGIELLLTGGNGMTVLRKE
ncbi:serine hydrolase [Halobacteriales archaeon QS_5_70_15]|nr:MAG: serine hydrolase [Halobacteriales archaeon QS_5_70_15]